MNLSPEKSKECAACELQENMEILRQIFFFAGVPLERLKLFAYICSQETFRAGDYLFQRGNDDGQSFFIIDGRAELIFPGEDESDVIREFGPGDFLGGLSLLGTMRRVFSLRAVTRLTCLIMSREKFWATVDKFPDLLPKIVQALVENIGAMEERCFSERSKTCEACRHGIGVSLV